MSHNRTRHKWDPGKLLPLSPSHSGRPDGIELQLFMVLSIQYVVRHLQVFRQTVRLGCKTEYDPTENRTDTAHQVQDPPSIQLVISILQISHTTD